MTPLKVLDASWNKMYVNASKPVVEFFAIKRKDITAAKKLPPVGLNLMINRERDSQTSTDLLIKCSSR